MDKNLIQHDANDNAHVTRGELRLELAQFRVDLKNEIIPEIRQMLFEAMELQREYFDKKFARLEGLLERHIAQTAIHFTKHDARITTIEKELGLEVV